MTVTYVLHGMNCMMQLPCEKFLNKGGIDNRNLMQLLCAVWAMQKECEIVEFRAMWESRIELPCSKKY